MRLFASCITSSATSGSSLRTLVPHHPAPQCGPASAELRLGGDTPAEKVQVIVMDQGRVAEFGDTTQLADDKRSMFSTFL